MKKHHFIAPVLYLLIGLNLTACMPEATVGADGQNSTLEDSLTLSETLLVLKRNKEKKVTISGGKPPYQSESTNESLGTVFLEPEGDIITVRTKPNFTGNFSVVVSDAAGAQISMTVDVVDGFSLFPASRQVYPGRKVQITPLEGDISSYEYTLVEGAEHAEVDEQGLVSVNPDAPDNTTVTIEVVNPSSGENERSFLYVREQLDSENISMSIGSSHTCLAKTNVNDSSRAIQCWGSNNSGTLGHPSGLIESRAAISVENTDILVSMASQAVKSVHLANDFACATYYNGPRDNSRNSRFIKCWGSGIGSGNTSAGLYPNTMGTALTSHVFQGDSGPINIKQVEAGHDFMCGLLTSFDSSSILGNGPNDGEIRCWGWGHYEGQEELENWRSTGWQSGRLGTNASVTTRIDAALKNKDSSDTLTYAFGIGSPVQNIVNYPNYVNTVEASFDAYTSAVDGNLDRDELESRIEKVKARQIAVGHSHACAIRTDAAYLDQVTCWGDNSKRQVSSQSSLQEVGGNLFDLARENRLSNPNNTFNPPVTPKTIFAGYHHNCMIGDSDDRLYCWGNNSDRQSNPSSGSGAINPSNSLNPVLFRTETGTELNVISGAAGLDFTCVIVNSVSSATKGRVMCFGSNSSGQHGLGRFGGPDGQPQNGEYVDLGNRTTPEGDSVPYEAVRLVAAKDSVCAMLEKTSPSANGHNVKCWGENSNNQLGYGDTIDRAKASDAEGFTIGDGQVVDLSSSISGGVCALKLNGNMFCWGDGKNGKLGKENFLSGHLDGINALDAVPYTDLNTFGLEIKKITASNHNNCVLYKSGGTHCWGNAHENQLGTASGNDVGDDSNELNGLNSYVAGNNRTFKDVVLTTNNGCAIDSDDQVRCWGANYSGIKGSEDNTNNFEKAENAEPIYSLSDKKALKLTGGLNFVCGIFENNIGAHEVYCWGDNLDGQLGRTTNSRYVGSTDRRRNENPTPLAEHLQSPVNIGLGPQEEILDLKAGSNHVCALVTKPDASDENYVKCWGESTALGVEIDPSGGVTPRYSATQFVTPKLDFGGENPVELSAGSYYSCVLFDTERVKCWGRNNNNGVLGWTAGMDPRIPAPKGSGYVNFGAGRRATRIFGSGPVNHTCAVLDVDDNQDGLHDIKCWGSNSRGQLGIGSTIDSGSDGFSILRQETSLVRYRVN